MRAIKFRAWDADNKIMWIDLTALECLVQSIKFPEAYKHFTFMQFTGLRDKNGKEIYEGDIILAGRFYTVEWKVGAFIAKSVIYPALVTFLLRDRYEEIDIIGNIYTHPEFLTA